ncbi:bifunctional uroporphyrinogen-III synthetase/response regulator domain protein [Wenjunlia vitaminophila]|uniref:Bifunctional uroporphyrinogen-III synthetase/response regulator domain protein n=1 Tax=Wenjunlia vitaminophila TaxID=76728 RepID=A0A0T6LPN7_WENVI|nr:uroporphyrinogen-III synthase [Wenjunlia vitaminophila]KRV47913.1 bifunctional uroporphyrinogen-III synthetase/response regulator domain protein [Wenjunlia vitaminophila]
MRDHSGVQDNERAVVPPLAGFTVGVTAARRADDLAALLTRRGATVMMAPALRLVPLFDDVELLAVTRRMLADPPDKVVATTAIGFRGWIEAADGWGVGEALRACLDEVELLARGPKVRGAIRAAGLTDAWSPPSESMAEVLDRLLAEGVRGQRIAVQLHGEPLPGFVESLRAAGAEPLGIPVYRWLPPTDIAPMDRLLDAVVGCGVDAVTFTSAPAAVSLLDRAAQRGMREEVLEAFRHRVLPACVGPVTATVLESRGVPTVQPERYRLGPLAQLVVSELPARVRPLPVAGHRLEIRGHAVLVDGELRQVAPAGMGLLRALAARPGSVVPRAELLRVLPGAGTDEHAVETAMARLRGALGRPRLIQTVVKRGYRLALDASSQDDDGCMSREDA